MKPRSIQRQSFKVSLTLHGIALVLVLAIPWVLKACDAKKPNEKLMFVEFTVSLPAPPAADVPDPVAPEPPPPPTDDIKIPEKKPEKKLEKKPPPPPKKKEDIRQTTRITRKGPPPKDNPLSEAEIAKLLKQGARISDTTRIPTGNKRALASYYNHVHERMYAVWQQPGQLKNLPGLQTEVEITVAPDGRITARRKLRGSGNQLMDDSVMKAVRSLKALRALPAGYRKPVDITIIFEIGD